MASPAPAKADDKSGSSYIGLKDLTDAGRLAAKRQEAERLRNVLKREWALNREYYNGNQWAFWNSMSSRVEALPTDSGPTWKVRLQSNQIKPGLSSFVAQLLKTRPTIYAEPNSGGDTDVKAAQMATSLFESLYEDLNLNSKSASALTEAGLSGGYWLITWDPLAGTPMTFVMDPQGQPILDDELAQVFMDEVTQMAQQQGADPQELLDKIKQTVYLGDISVKTLMAENVLIDPSAASFEDAKWAICRHSMDPDEVKARFGADVTPNAIKSADLPLAFSNVEERKPVLSVREVFVMYIRPCPALPKGRYVAWTEGPDKILQDMEWPYPHRFLPLVKWPGIYRPDSPYDDPIVSEARPLQKTLNKKLSSIVEHQNIVMRPQLMAPIGSLRTKLTSEPGAVFEYNPVGGVAPQWRPMPDVPQSLIITLQDLQARIDRVFNRIPSQRDQIPARADGGGILEAMQEATADQVSTIILGIEDALARAGTLMASLAQKYYEEPRLLRVRGAGGSVQVKKFEASDIDGGFVFKARYGTGLPRTRQGKHDAIMDLLGAQVIDAPTALRELDLTDLKGVQAKIAADEDQAFREHDKMLRGIPINQGALQQAQQQLQQFHEQAAEVMQTLQAGQPVDLDGDGQPDDPQKILQQLQQQEQELEQQLSDAPWQPLDFENWQAHIEAHGDLMKTASFEMYPPEVQAIFIQHFNLTYQRYIEVKFAMPAEGTKPTINMRVMTTATPSVASKILGKSGIQVDPTEFTTEQALDTTVTDDLSKPKVNGSGDDPLSQADQALSIQQAQDQHVAAQAAAAQKMGLAEEQAAQAQAKHDMEMQGLAQQQQQLQEQHEAAQVAARSQGKN